MADEHIPTVSLITDFGTRDHYVGAMKGAMLKVHSQMNIVDITHEVAPQDILEAAFQLYCTYRVFPTRSIHVVVVDPGVGTDRRCLLACTTDYYFIAPDNGVLSFIYANDDVSAVYSLTESHYYRRIGDAFGMGEGEEETPQVSTTFHGRDIMGPCAAWLAKGTPADHFGEEVTDYVKINVPRPGMAGEKAIRGLIIHVDRFGNIITNISEAVVKRVMAEKQAQRFAVALKGKQIAEVRTNYLSPNKDVPFMIFGSSGHLEIALATGSAAAAFQARRGEVVDVLLG